MHLKKGIQLGLHLFFSGVHIKSLIFKYLQTIMNEDSFKVLFLISATRKNKKGLVPIMCRITYIGQRKPFATGLFINPKNWYSKLQLAKPPNEEHTFINKELSLIKNKLNQAFLFLNIQQTPFTAEDIYSQYKGKPAKRQIGVVSHYQDYLQKHQKLIGIEIKQSTWNKFSYILTDLKGLH